MIYKKIFISIISLIVVFAFSANIAFCAKEVETYKVDNMEFTVGEHKPKERVNPKKKDVQFITETVIVSEDEQLPGLLDKNLVEDILEEDEKKEVEKENDVNFKKVKFDDKANTQEKKKEKNNELENLISSTFEKVWAEIKTIKENILSIIKRLDDIENKINSEDKNTKTKSDFENDDVVENKNDNIDNTEDEEDINNNEDKDNAEDKKDINNNEDADNIEDEVDMNNKLVPY